MAEAALQTPHGGDLVDLMLPTDQVEAAVNSCTKTVECTDRQACDVELLSVGCESTAGRAREPQRFPSQVA